MAAQTITYGDKSYLNELPDIPAINKVQDIDMNEIKSVVNNNASEVTMIENYLTFTNTETITTGTITGGATLSSMSVAIETNSDSSLAKIYGQLDIATGGHDGNITIATDLRPTSQIIVQNVYRNISYQSYVRNTSLIFMTINTDGTVVIPYTQTGISTGETCRLSIIGTLIFIKNIGS